MCLVPACTSYQDDNPATMVPSDGANNTATMVPSDGANNDDIAPLVDAADDDYYYPVRSPTPVMYKHEHLEKENLLRRPVDYHTMGGAMGGSMEESTNESAAAARYKYYNRLAGTANDGSLTMPVHVVPSVFVFRSTRTDKDGAPQQPSWVTIFSLWNTMMGTSLLSIPWAIQQAGFVTGILLLLLMCLLMLYTSYRTLTSVTGVKSVGGVLEFHDVCRHYLGRWAERLALVSGLVSFGGALVVYFILMSNFLHSIVAFIYHHAASEQTTHIDSDAAVCPSMCNNSAQNVSTDGRDQTFRTYWDEQKTVPFAVLFLVAPLVNFKSPTFFTRLNAMGAVTVSYMLVFVTILVTRWGIHFQSRPLEADVYEIPEFKATFPALTGVAVYGYFVQNSLLSITRTQRHPENNVRDLVIAYILVACTFLYMGIMFYISFPDSKQCIEDNLLKNISDTNSLGFVARIGLLLQLLSIYPLLIYVFRLQAMTSLFGKAWPSFRHILILNVVLLGLSLIFAIFLPHIGRILGFVGAWCGFSYGFALPCLVYMRRRYNNNTLNKRNIVFHVLLILFGGANFVAQFALI